jgi:hypothetical protein
MLTRIRTRLTYVSLLSYRRRTVKIKSSLMGSADDGAHVATACDWRMSRYYVKYVYWQTAANHQKIDRSRAI